MRTKPHEIEGDAINDGYVLTTEGGVPTWMPAAGGSSLTVQDENSNVGTGVTQIDFQGAGVTAAAGTGEVVVTIAGETLPVSIIDAKGDLVVGTADNTATRKAVGSDGQVLTADAASTGGIKWAAPSGGYTDPLTTKGDLVSRTSSATVRVGVGTNGQVLTADSTATPGVKWAPVPSTIKTATFKLGTVLIGTGATRLYNDTGGTWTLLSVRASVESAPSGGSVIIDLNKNGTTVFTTQANRPTITSTNLTSGKVTAIDVTSVADGDYLTVDVDTTTSPAAQLTVTVVYSE